MMAMTTALDAARACLTGEWAARVALFMFAWMILATVLGVVVGTAIKRASEDTLADENHGG